jgi:hypothetical protein
MPIGSHGCLDGFAILHPKLLEYVLNILSLADEGALLELLDLKVKGKCALGPFLSILVIECQHKCLNVNSCLWMDKVQNKSKGMFLSLSTLVLCTNILV